MDRKRDSEVSLDDPIDLDVGEFEEVSLDIRCSDGRGHKEADGRDESEELHNVLKYQACRIDVESRQSRSDYS